MGTISIVQILFCFALWSILVFGNIKQIRYIQNTRSKGIGLIFFLIVATVFCVFDYYGDYLHYKGLYESVAYSNDKSYMEPIFQWLIEILPKNYSLWRLAVWFPSLVLLIIIIKKLHLPNQFSILLFALMLIVYFGAPRNTLGYVTLYCGGSFILTCKDSKNVFINFLIGTLLIFASVYLHRSMILYVFIFTLALIPFNKWIYVFSILAFPIVYKFLLPLFSSLSTSILTSQESLDLAERYVESDFRIHANLGGIIRMIINRAPFFILMIYSVYHIYFKKNHIVQYKYKVFLQAAYLLMYMSYLFNGQNVSSFLSPRFWDASIYPVFIFSSAYLYDKTPYRCIRVVLYLLIIMNLYTFLYSLFS